MKINFGFRKKENKSENYDLQEYAPVMKCSICTGEQVAGFKNRKTGQFTEIMLIRNEGDLEDFKQRYKLEEVKKEY